MKFAVLLRSHPRLAMGLAAVLAALAVGRMVLGGVAVEVAVASRDVPIRVYGLGTIEAKVASKIGFAVAGTLAELRADAGDGVAKGQVLARLDDAEQRAKVAAARAQYDKALAQSTSARAIVAKAAANRAQKEKVSQRRKSLVASGTISEETFGDAQAAAVSAGADAQAANAEVSLALATLADARAQLELNEVLLARHVLTAPYDGRISLRSRELGSVVAPGEGVFTLFDPETVWVLSYVDETQAGGVAVGQEAEVRLRSEPARRFAGRVVRIDIESDRTTEERKIYVACRECPQNLGEQAEVVIDAARLDSATLVPLSAIQGFDGRQGLAWVVENGRLARRTLSFGRRTLDGRLEVVGGLSDGIRVVTRLTAGLAEGLSVRMSDAAP
ncbi:efflux transporter periplasmic adaptor subunit [Magnetospirillum sp. ME-1]|uniref:efflux RND transporter periplasmic adaptor subunit n=1 Tax=Magnetospirillum sp. ME-1 TaxID=1639348 RepID=UPI000A17B5A1|nr:efflux RND transporter periplasmic adaptor subunit [Magnetospirillum sp. ME-1]ARJ65374.1 efflux transporter periplasmic adaptor subunit [Magnetospirillum sp. ME-1]